MDTGTLMDGTRGLFRCKVADQQTRFSLLQEHEGSDLADDEFRNLQRG